MNTPEEQDPTWRLLLKSKSQQPGPAFVRDVVREARKLGVEGQESGLAVFFAWFKKPIVAVPVAIGASAAVISALALIQSFAPSQDANSTAMATVNSQTVTPSAIATPATDDTSSGITEDLQRIDYLDELVAITDPRLLDDAALADLLY